MKILPESQIENLPILEEVLEELRLNVIDGLQNINDALNLYSMNSKELKEKLNLLGLSNITVGKFMSISLESDEFEFISPEFYKMYRKLNQHRGNRMSIDYILHSGGMMNTLVHSNTEFYNGINVFSDSESFFDFSSFRDNQFPELGIGDGFIIVPYASSKFQLLKSYLAKNPIIFQFLPAGYTFVFLSEYRTGYNSGVLQYDNLLNTKDVDNNYWEEPSDYDVEEEILNRDGTSWMYTHHLRYYDPFYFRDFGNYALEVDYPRYNNDSLYIVPQIHSGVIYPNLSEYLDDVYASIYIQMMNAYTNQGYEPVLNNIWDTPDVWRGDYLVSYFLGENVISEYYDHVKGLMAFNTPSYSYLSLFDRGQSLASQYALRESAVVSKYNDNIQMDKKNIISDREELDMFSITFDSAEEERNWDS